MTHYQVLGVASDATVADIRAAYHRLARRHHPDFHAGESAGEQLVARRRMQEVNEAWRVLSDPARRRAYDAALNRAAGPGTRPVAGEDRPFWVVDDSIDDDSWAAERERWIPDEALGERRPLLVAPVLLLALTLGCGVLWLALGSPALLALAALSGAGALVLFVVVPILVMAESRKN